MGVDGQPLWEVQWHPGSGGRVRRLVLTRGGLRRATAALIVLGVVVLGLLGILPLGVRSFFARFTVTSARNENRQLKAASADLGERVDRVAGQLRELLQRSRRIAWVTGAREAWQPPVPPPPPAASADDEGFLQWFADRGAQLDVLGTALASSGGTGSCPLPSLPTGTPLVAGHAVPVSTFGWRISPFTGQQEANYGVLLAAPEREQVAASGAGRVAFAGTVRERRANEWTRFGTLVVIDHGGGVITIYAHLRDTLVKRGQTVTRGARIGIVGRTGWTKVPALYYEIRWPIAGVSRPVDPALFCLTIPLDDPDARFADPTAGLPSAYADIGHLGVK